MPKISEDVTGKIFSPVAWRRILPAVITVIFISRVLLAEDVVVTSGKDGTGQLKRKGEILDYNGRGVRVRGISGRSKTIPLDEVIRVETQLCNSHELGNAAMAAGKYEKAVEYFETAVRDSEESRSWVRRRILASVIQCQHSLGNHDVACHYFVGLLRNDVDTPHFDVIPLAWLPNQRLSERNAERWIADKVPAARVLAASYLLSTGLRDQAIQVLQTISQADKSRTGLLAEAQLWRTGISTASREAVEQWAGRVAKFPQTLRGGPYYVVGQARAKLGDHDQAAIAFMHVPILFPHQTGLSAEALLASGRSLARSDRTNDAARLLREVIHNYPKSGAAAEAQQRLEALQEALQKAP
ncbi:MAG: tetratricopeptide repeat protein [Pirellulales bacterium]